MEQVKIDPNRIVAHWFTKPVRHYPIFVNYSDYRAESHGWLLEAHVLVSLFHFHPKQILIEWIASGIVFQDVWCIGSAGAECYWCFRREEDAALALLFAPRDP